MYGWRIIGSQILDLADDDISAIITPRSYRQIHIIVESFSMRILDVYKKYIILFLFSLYVLLALSLKIFL